MGSTSAFAPKKLELRWRPHFNRMSLPKDVLLDTPKGIIDGLELLAKRYDLEFEKEYRIRDSHSTVDAVWLRTLEGIGRIPVAAFEIESSKHSTKHTKGSIFNLNWLGAGLKVIVLVRGGVALYERTQQLIADSKGDIALWTAEDLADLLNKRFRIFKWAK